MNAHASQPLPRMLVSMQGLSITAVILEIEQLIAGLYIASSHVVPRLSCWNCRFNFLTINGGVGRGVVSNIKIIRVPHLYNLQYPIGRETEHLIRVA